MLLTNDNRRLTHILVLFLLALCFNTITVFTRHTDQLPVVWHKDGFCRHLTSKEEECHEDEEESWEVQYQTSYKDNFRSTELDNIHCRLECLRDPKCILVTYANTHKCHLHDVYQPNHQYFDSNYELSILSCCKSVEQMYITNTIIDQSVSGELFKHIDKKSQRPCYKTGYVKYKGQDSGYGDIKFYENVTVENCMTFCNDLFSCVLFNFANGKCHLKHVLKDLRNEDVLDLYVLSCFPVITMTCTTCTTITNRNTKCESPKSIVWSLTSQFKLSGGYFTTYSLNLDACFDVCLLSSSCLAISYNNVNKECELFASVEGEAKPDNDSEYAVLQCAFSG